MKPSHLSQNTAYDCRIPFEPVRIHAAAVYCSDGRFGEHFDEFLEQGLGLPRYDRLVLPGGPVGLIPTEEEPNPTSNSVIEDLCFLVNAHQLERVVLIAHDGCAYYTERLQLTGSEREHMQHEDLAYAAALVREHTGIQSVECWFARIVQDGVCFEPVGSE